ncbi:MAG: lysylphosphatidylglycerol synthase transmembrane domain-containing protein [Muribaculaceae bacterium]
MTSNNEKQTKGYTFRPLQIIIPIIIGIGVVMIMFIDEFSDFKWSSIQFTTHTVLALAIACCFVVGRDFGLTWRFRIITNNELSWTQALRVCMLCEFTSAITPTAVGGSGVGMLFLNREGISWGRGTTLMLITIFLDELFFVISCPLIMLITPSNELFSSLSADFTSGVRVAFWGVYGVITLWTLILFLGIIVKPHLVRSALIYIFRIKWLKRWQHGVAEFGDNMVMASIEIKQKSIKWWTLAFSSTIFSWTSRYLVVNALFWGFVAGADQWLVLARQFVVWLLLMVSPTPGGSGVSEWLFTRYYADMIPVAALALIIALIWRILSYYVYLLIGALIMPSWIKKFKKK